MAGRCQVVGSCIGFSKPHRARPPFLLYSTAPIQFGWCDDSDDVGGVFGSAGITSIQTGACSEAHRCSLSARLIILPAIILRRPGIKRRFHQRSWKLNSIADVSIVIYFHRQLAVDQPLPHKATQLPAASTCQPHNFHVPGFRHTKKSIRCFPVANIPGYKFS